MSPLWSWLTSFLPEATRRRLDPGQRRSPTLCTAIIQMAAGLLLGVTGLMGFRLDFYRRTLAAGLPGLDQEQGFGYGAVMYLSFLLSLRGLVSVYLFLEGGVRALSAIYVEEPCPSLVVSAVDWAVRRWRRRKLAPPQPETLAEAGGELVLETDRRRDWDAETTVVHDGEYYAVRGVEQIEAERWRYRLGPIPERWLIRGVRRVQD